MACVMQIYDWMLNVISFACMAYVLCVYMYDWMLNEISYVGMTHAGSSAVDAAKSYDNGR